MNGLAVIGRADASGLGTMTVEFCRNMAPERVLIVSYSSRGQTDAARIPGCRVVTPQELTRDALEWLCDGMRAVVGFETFYSGAIFEAAAKYGTKTVLFPMWECTPPWCEIADFALCVSQMDYQAWSAERPAHAVRWPVCRESWRPKAVNNPPRVFVHNAGTLGMHGRNGTEYVLNASKALRGTGAELLVRSIEPIPPEWRSPDDFAAVTTNILPAGKLYAAADVFVFPMRFPGLSLPMLEAAACRIPTIVLDLPEWDSYPAALRCKTAGDKKRPIGFRMVRFYLPDVADLQRIIRGLATGEIEPELPPEPETWDGFRRTFAEILGWTQS